MSGRNYVMTVAGFDPSGGAGILADIKTIESHKVLGLAVNTANTIQTETKFHSIKWEELKHVLETIDVLMDEYPVSVVKTGIVPSFDFLYEMISHIKNKNLQTKIIVDPIIRSSTGYDFMTGGGNKKFIGMLGKIFLLTPNSEEAISLTGKVKAEEAAAELAKHCNVLLKGGHHISRPGFDYLHSEGNCTELPPTTENVYAKHGSGCVLSAAIASNLALGADLKTACSKAKLYTAKFLGSHESLLGYHAH